MKAALALEFFSRATELVRRDAPSVEIYHSIETALNEVIGSKLLTILRLEGSRLKRLHTSDLPSYPVGGSKDISHDAWLQSMLQDGVPVISADPQAVRQRFVDHETIFGLGCGAVMNLPVICPSGTLGSLNLLHEPGWFSPQHILLAAPFASLLAVMWLAPASPRHAGEAAGSGGSANTFAPSR